MTSNFASPPLNLAGGIDLQQSARGDVVCPGHGRRPLRSKIPPGLALVMFGLGTLWLQTLSAPPAQSEIANTCENGSAPQKRVCLIRALNRLGSTIELLVAQACRQHAATASEGVNKGEFILLCRVERTAMIVAGINSPDGLFALHSKMEHSAEQQNEGK